MLNVFNEDTVTTIVTTITDSSNSPNLNGRPVFAAFNPFTETPKECPQGTSNADCQAMGANWRKAANFGQPSSNTAFQSMRTWRVSLGVRF